MAQTLYDIVKRAEFQLGLDEKLITIREDGQGLRILNYSDAALYTPGAWDNGAVRACRGLIIDDQDRIVARPWSKFFNHGQPEAGDLDLTARVEVTDKMDGSLGIIHRRLDGSLAVATRGSFQSDQAIHATKVLNARYAEALDADAVQEFTPLVEIIYPDNRIVCDYGDQDDLVLLGGVHISTGAYLGPGTVSDLVCWQGPVVQTFPFLTLRDALAAPPRPGAEGMCVRYEDESRIVKIKQDDYVALHRIVTGLSERVVWEHMAEGKPLGDLLGPLPDELHQWTREVWTRIESDTAALIAQAKHTHEDILSALPPDFDRGTYAARAKEYKHLTPWLFNLLDGRDPRDRILRTLKPEGSIKPRTYSEATA